MRHLGREVESGDREVFLLEDGYNEDTRAVVVLVRPDDPRFVLERPPPPAVIPNRGEWRAVARWTADGLRLAHGDFGDQVEWIEARVADHLTKVSRPAPRLWTVERDGAWQGSLAEAVPMGVAVHCWSNEDDARAAAAEPAPHAGSGAAGSGAPGVVVPVDDQARFLNACVRQGYAGGLLDGAVPVFFCIDEAGALQHLRVRPGDAGEIAMEILDEDDDWSAYDGAESIAFLDNGEACDERLVATIGRRPPLDWPADGRLVCIGPRAGTPALVEDDAFETPAAVLFTEREPAEEFKDDHDPAWVLWEVDDVRAFLGDEALSGTVAHLNPGGHRARGGVLWRAGEQAVLDAFSGFWKVTAEGFETLD